MHVVVDLPVNSGAVFSNPTKNLKISILLIQLVAIISKRYADFILCKTDCLLRTAEVKKGADAIGTCRIRRL